MELVHNTKSLVAGSPKASIVTALALAVAAICLGLLLARVGSAGSESSAGAVSTRPSVLAGLSPESRRYVEAIERLTPAQRVAAFGTPSANDLRESDYVAQIGSMTPVQRVEAFGTDTNAAAALASLSPRERLYVESITTMTPAQLRAVFGTSR